MMKISPEKRIWVNGVRFDMFKQKYDNVSELCHARLDDVIDDRWKFAHDHDDAYTIYKSDGASIGCVICFNGANRTFINANTLKIYEDAEMIRMTSINEGAAGGFQFDGKFVNITIEHVPNNSETDDDYIVTVEMYDVPYALMNKSKIDRLNLVSYPLVWTISTGGINPDKYMMFELSSDKPAVPMLRIKPNNAIDQHVSELYEHRMIRFERTPYGITNNAVVLLKPDMRTALSLFDENESDADPYLILSISDECPHIDGVVTLIALENPTSPITMTFKEFMYAYRGVFSTEAAFIMNSNVYVCTNGCIICRKATKKLEKLITENIAPPISTEKINVVYNYICEKYVPKQAIDQIIVSNKEYGFIVRDVAVLNGKIVSNSSILKIEED